MRIIVILISLFFTSHISAMSYEFEKMINIVGIPRYNVLGHELNEELYITYNQFIYASPTQITGRQRWKNVNEGRWTEGGGMWRGSGNRGEYYAIGTDYSGVVVHNFYFPVDRTPKIPPHEWNYCNFNGALNSWNDTSRYKFADQLSHMKNTNIIYDRIDYNNNHCNPYDLVEYPINALQINLNRCQLELAATWNTNGVILIRRYIDGIWWETVFLVKPMAADVKLNSEVKFDKKPLTLDENTKELFLDVEFGANVTNYSGYAKKEHIKEIKSELYLENEKQDELSIIKNDNGRKKARIKIDRSKLEVGKVNRVKIKSSSYMITEFSADGMYKDENTQYLEIDVKKLRPPNPLEDKEVKRLYINGENEYCVSNILKHEDVPIFQGGQYIVNKITFRDKIQTIKANDDSKFYKINEKQYINVKKIPIDTDSTLASYEDLRNESGNYFRINTAEILKPLKDPYTVKFEYKYEDFDYNCCYQFNVIGNILNNFNYNFTSKNPEKYNKESIYNWLNIKKAE